MADKPLVGQADRPDLTVNAEGAGSEPRDLGTILGTSGPHKLKEIAEKVIIKEGQKEIVKEHKENKDFKDQKDHKEPKDHKDSKDNKDQKEHKDPKDSKDQKDQKDPKEHKDQKDQKEHKDPKEHKDQKDLKDHKEISKELVKENVKEITDTVKREPEAGPIPEQGDPTEAGQLIHRVSGLEQQGEESKKKK